MITRDAEATLEAALASLIGFPEVIVYDNGSTDRTLEIAAQFPNVTIHRGDFVGFGPTKNRAAGLARHDWIFSIDSDEQVSAALMAGICTANLADRGVGYEVLRQNYFMGKPVARAGWGNDWLFRLYDRRTASFTDALVHENLRFHGAGRTERLNGTLDHHAARDVGGFLVKVNRYSELRRQERRRAPPPAAIFLRAVWAFWRTYLLQLGFLEGWRGLVIAWSNANGVFFKYMKAYADRAVAEEQESRRALAKAERQ
jgi:glycosyltransferase involved in cell wall biosynthesis